MIRHPAVRSLRLDGLEAMLCAVVFIATTTVLLLLRVTVGIREMGMVALGAGVATVWVLRRFRPTRATAAHDGDHVVAPRSLASLLLLGVGWFVLVIAALFTVVAAAIMSDPEFRAMEALLLPVVPLLLGGGLVYAGLRMGRGSGGLPAVAAVARPSQSRASASSIQPSR